MTNILEEQYIALLNSAAEDLDIPPYKFMEAVRKYASVGELLNTLSPGTLGTETVQIYTQGSFSLGTVVRPLRKGGTSEYDIDLVCQLPIEQGKTTPSDIKTMIGDKLKSNGTYANMLDNEGSRCWTLNYAIDSEGVTFHMDILPCVAEKSVYTNNKDISPVFGDTTIGITHKCGMGKNAVYSWLSSNPRGYRQWFTAINTPALNSVLASRRKAIFDNNKGVFDSVDAVPEELVKTPLQKAIQISKRHRDMIFSGLPNEDEKPISMIITTLFASLYANETNTFLALKNILEKLKKFSVLLTTTNVIKSSPGSNNIIERSADGKWYIMNPINKDENFADKWNFDASARAKAFFQWVDLAYKDLVEILKLCDIKCITEALNKSLGIKAIGKSTVIPFTEIRSPNKPWKES